MLPDMSMVLDAFLQSIILKIVTQISDESTSFRPELSIQNVSIKGVVQVARPQDIQKDEIDYNLRYLQVHIKEEAKINDKIEYQGQDYNVISVSNYNDYGYHELICEQSK